MDLMNLTIRQTLAMVEGETTVPAVLLAENEDFMEYAETGEATYQELVDWVNENY